MCFNMLFNVGHVFHDGVCGHHVAYDIFPYFFFGGGQGGPIIHQLG